MQNKNIKIFLSVILLLIIGIIVAILLNNGSSNTTNIPNKYDTFATCLKDKGLTFYGAFWCPHCQAQKKLFGSSAKFLPYVECSTPDGREQNQVCKDKNIPSYPFWTLKDGTKIPNENDAGVTLETLALKSSCELPK